MTERKMQWLHLKAYKGDVEALKAHAKSMSMTWQKYLTSLFEAAGAKARESLPTDPAPEKPKKRVKKTKPESVDTPSAEANA